jgi:hypothetical protein
LYAAAHKRPLRGVTEYRAALERTPGSTLRTGNVDVAEKAEG